MGSNPGSVKLFFLLFVSFFLFEYIESVFCSNIAPPPPPPHFFYFLNIVQYLFVPCTIPSILGSHPPYTTSPPTLTSTLTHPPIPPTPTPHLTPHDPPQKKIIIIFFCLNFHKNFNSSFTSTLTPHQLYESINKRIRDKVYKLHFILKEVFFVVSNLC